LKNKTSISELTYPNYHPLYFHKLQPKSSFDANTQMSNWDMLRIWKLAGAPFLNKNRDKKIG
jgi:hypothetical protein